MNEHIQMQIYDIQVKLQTTLTEERYEHTLGVMYTAGCLAMAHGYDVSKAMLTGLLHDCAKCMRLEEMLRWCDTYHFPITEMERNSKNLLHAKAGAVVAEQEYHINDREILASIACHCTGKPDMSTLDKIVYIADFIEPGRKEAKNLDAIRQLAFDDLDACIAQITYDILNYLKEKGYVIDPTTEETYHFYKACRKEIN